MTILKLRDIDSKIDGDGNIISSNAGFDFKKLQLNKYKISLNKTNTIVYDIYNDKVYRYNHISIKNYKNYTRYSFEVSDNDNTYVVRIYDDENKTIKYNCHTVESAGAIVMSFFVIWMISLFFYIDYLKDYFSQKIKKFREPK